MAASQGSTITHTPGLGGGVVTIEGVIDDSFNRARLIEANGIVVIDLDGVHRITSFGVREWVHALKDLNSSYVGFIKARPAMVSQFNMVANFAGRGELLSLYAPFICGQCGKEIQVLYDLRKQYSEVKNLSLAPVTCPDCKIAAEFDDVPDSYFSYVIAAPQPKPPYALDALLKSGSVTGASRSLHVDKEVEESVTALWFSGHLDQVPRVKRLMDGLEGKVVLVCEGITACTDTGVSQLAQLFDIPEAEVFVARVPDALLVAASKRPGAWGRARLVSVRLPMTCMRCKRSVYDNVEKAQLQALLAVRATPAFCPECGGTLSATFSKDVMEALRKAPIADAPADVAQYLKSHLVPPARRIPAAAPAVPLGGDESPGSAEFGRYRLIRLLGTGGMAEVFLARQSSVGGFEKNIVVKRILPQLSMDETFVQMLLQEARLAARISHPNVVQIFDVGQVGTRYFIAMEYVRGMDLAALLRLCTRINYPLPFDVAVRIGAEIAAGLHAAHACVDDKGQVVPIVHRDVSPHNVLISSDGRVKLTDFGIAKAVDTSSRTPTETLKGKLSYMAPEQVRASPDRRIDGRTDLFAAGLILYQCLTLEHPFRRETEFATFKAILNDPVSPISGRRSDVPPQLDVILSHALAREMSKRYLTALAFQQDLERLLATVRRPVGAAEVSEWFRDVTTRAEATGQLPPDLALTPTNQSPPASKRETTAATASLIKND